jgi:DNA-binding response OmpR family regulator
MHSNPLVLVADDEPQMLELVTRHLKTIDAPKLEVIAASDGDQAWQLAREHLPDLVVLDVMMPGMSGWEVCRKIREDISLAHTGVVMLTGIGENLNQMTSPLYGADAYIDKPFDFGELDQKIREALAARASQRGAIERPMVNGVSGPASAAPKKRAPKAKAKAAPKAKAAAPKKSAPKKKAKPVAKAAPKKAAKKPAKKAKSAPKKSAAKKSPAKKKRAKPAKKSAKKKKK